MVIQLAIEVTINLTGSMLDMENKIQEKVNEVGHKRTNLQIESNANKELDYKPSFCIECGNALSIFNYVETRQTHDILIQKEVINHNITIY